MKLPEKYINSMRELLGDEELEAYLASFDKPRLYGLRVNTAKISAEDFLKISPFKLTPIPWIPNGFYYSEDDKPAKHPYYFAGLYYLQEPSAMTPANVLPIEKGDKVLDLCAAPGGKSTELGARLKGTGLLVSNDVSASRAKALLKNIEIFGIGNVLVTCEYPEKLAETFGGFFDKILVDAPCSGEGMFRKDGRLIKSWESQGPEFFAPLQRTIIDSAACMLRPGGYMLYSTCTFSRPENEDNIRYFLDGHPDFALRKIYEYPDFVRAFGMKEAVRLFPHHIDGEGHFVALLYKDDKSGKEKTMDEGGINTNAAGEIFSDIYGAKAVNITGKSSKLPGELLDFLSEFKKSFDTDRITVSGEKVYLRPEYDAEIKGLRILRNGLLLGELKKNRFEPSQALAMTVRPEDYSTTARLASDNPNVIKYLKGETIEINEKELTGSSKNILVTVDGFPLGWGRLGGLTIKNKYLPGWRWM